MTIDLYVHAMWPSENKNLKDSSLLHRGKVKQYEQALFDQIKNGSGKVVIVSSSKDKDQKLVELAKKSHIDYVQVLSVQCKMENKSTEHYGHIANDYISVIEEIAFSEHVSVSGFAYGQCPTGAYVQALFMKDTGIYFPLAFENHPIILERDKILTPYEEKKISEIKHIPNGWGYRITATYNRFTVVPEEEHGHFTSSLTDEETKIFLLNKSNVVEKKSGGELPAQFRRNHPDEAEIIKQSLVF